MKKMKQHILCALLAACAALSPGRVFAAENTENLPPAELAPAGLSGETSEDFSETGTESDAFHAAESEWTDDTAWPAKPVRAEDTTWAEDTAWTDDPAWADGLPLSSAGYTGNYYFKD